MSVTADLVDFARTSGAISSVYKGDGIALTWDSGRSWQHIWDTKDSRRPQAFYGESEYLEPRVPTMISDYGEIMLKWAIMRIGEKRGGAAGGRESMFPRRLKASRPSGVSNSSPLSLAALPWMAHIFRWRCAQSSRRIRNSINCPM